MSSQSVSARASVATLTELTRYVSRFHARGWCEATSGNFSTTLERDPLALLISRSGFDKNRVSTGDFLVVDEHGARVDGDGKPSDETLLHVTLARETGAGAIFHTHSVWGALLGERFRASGGFTISGYEMQKAIRGIESHHDELFIPVIPNAQDLTLLASEVMRMLKKRPLTQGFLLAGHGLYTWGAEMAEAGRHVEGLEYLLEVVGRRTRFRMYEE